MTFEDLFQFNPTLLILAISVCVIALVSYISYLSKSPGPWGIPVLGYFPFLREDFHVQLHEFTQKYGKVYVINILGQNFLYLDDFKVAKEAHLTKADDFPTRSEKYSVLMYPLKEGLFSMKGEEWRVLRKFFVQSMRELGLTPNSEELKGPMYDAVLSTIEDLTKSKGEPLNIAALMVGKCSDIMTRFALGDDIGENVTSKLIECYMKAMSITTSKNIILVGNIAKYLILPFLTGHKEMVEGHKEMTKLLKYILNEHKRSFDLDQQPRDFIDLYLREKALKERKGEDQSKYFTDPALLDSLVQMVGDGSVSIGGLIATFLRELSNRPDAQECIYEEIVQVIGTERLPNFGDRNSLPITNSIIKELIRHETILTVIPDLESERDTTVCGVFVPKGTITLMNTWAMHKDPNIYENPEVFDIYRFHPDKPKVESPLIFGIGRRACIGETIVMSETLVFITAIMQNFRILPAFDGSTEKETGFDFDMGVKIKAIPRRKRDSNVS